MRGPPAGKEVGDEEVEGDGMTAILASRRHFLRGLGSILAAPAIVRVQNIMPVKVLPPDDVWELLRMRMGAAAELLRKQIDDNLYGSIASNITQGQWHPLWEFDDRLLYFDPAPVSNTAQFS